MKLLSARPEQDRADSACLAGILGLTAVDEALAAITGLYPPELLLPRTRFLVEEMFLPSRTSGEEESPHA